MLTAWLAGLVMGFAGSVPVAGPINMLVFSFGLQGRLRSATLIALGGALPEAFWAGLAFWGFTALLERYAWIEAGAAAQNIQLQATAEGLGSVLVAGFRDEATAAALALETPIMPLIHLCFGWPAMAQNRASTE